MNSAGKSLVELMSVKACEVVKTQTRDEEGNILSSYSPGREFDAAFVLKSSADSQSADGRIPQDTYTVTVPADVILPHYALIKRLDSGKVYRISAMASMAAPSCASFSFRQYVAKELQPYDGGQEDGE